MRLHQVSSETGEDKNADTRKLFYKLQFTVVVVILVGLEAGAQKISRITWEYMHCMCHLRVSFPWKGTCTGTCNTLLGLEGYAGQTYSTVQNDRKDWGKCK